MSQPEPQPERLETGSDVGQVLRGSEAPRLDASRLWESKEEGSIRASKNRYLFFAHKLIPRPPPRQPGAQAVEAGAPKGSAGGFASSSSPSLPPSRLSF